MRVAAVYDIHSNLPALEAVLADIREVSVDHVVVGGDVLPGPMPDASLDLLAGLDLPTSFIVGNGDREVLAVCDGRETDWYRTAREEWREPVRWTAGQLRPEHVRAIREWPASVRLDVDGFGEVLFCHATPRNDWECFTLETPERVLLPVFEPAGASTVVCGHTHMQFDRSVGSVRVVNAGSVGMPYGSPEACWLLLDADAFLRRTPYDLDSAAERVRRTSYPQAEDFIRQCFVDPPAVATMLELFGRAELA